MRTVTSACGDVEGVTARRAESSDAREIEALLGPSAHALFGKVNVIHLLERANLAVTLAGERGEVVGHASFLDHPLGGVVDQEHWESYLHTHFHAGKHTPLNTLFLHLFVAPPTFAPDSLAEILSAVFHAVTELEYVCLVSPHLHARDPVLEEVFEPLESRQAPPPCLALVSHRHQYCPRLHIRQARVEDHDDLVQILWERSKETGSCSRDSLVRLIEDQDQHHQVAVCESGGRAVGFMGVSVDVDLEVLSESFDLSALGGLYKPEPRPAGRHDDLTDPGAEQRVAVEDETGEDGQREAPEGSSEQHNVFCIQMFVMDKDHESRSVDFLPYIFKLFPQQDLCVVSVPRWAPEGPLLQSFQRVRPRPSARPPQELYLFHRTGLLKSVVVRRAVSEDRVVLCDLVAEVEGHRSLLDDLDMYLQARRDPGGTPVQAFVVQVESQVVGALVLRDEEDVDFLRAHYNLDSFVYFSQHAYGDHSRLCSFALRPLFRRHAELFLRSVLRLAHKTCLYRRTPRQAHPEVLSDGCLQACMVPVPPRPQVVLPLEELGLNAPSHRITQEQEAFAVHLLSRKLTLEPRVEVNSRVVVVGASQTGLAFLEVLCFCPHLHFNNLTLVSPHGLPDDRIHADAHFLSTSSPASRCRSSALLAVRSCVAVVTGKMVALDREEQQVVVSGGAAVPYDHLVLCTGLQYRVPAGARTGTRTLHQGPGAPPGPQTLHQGPGAPPGSQTLHQGPGAPPGPQTLHQGPVPPNLLTLTDQQDCEAARVLVCQEVLERGGDAVVYGRGLDVYTCVAALLGLGVPGARVHLVLPPAETPPEPCCFGDPEVAGAVGGALREAGVAVHADCVLAQVDTDPTSGTLTSVTFGTGGPPLQLPCGVLLNLSQRGVDYDAYRSAHAASLVLDRRLVVDAHSFCTSDPAVRGAGPLTKFSRRHRAGPWSHACCSSTEVGQALAAAMLALFDPTLDPAPPAGPASPDHLIPEYSQPKVQAGRLPGGYHYLHVTKPRPPGPPAPPPQGSEVVTGAAATGNYFRVHLDRYETVDTLTCLSLKPLPLANYLRLYGRHQRLLNHLLLRHRQALTSDLYSFFREPWSLALFHDRFPDLEEEVRSSLEEEVRSSLEEEVRSSLASAPLTSPALAALRSSVFNYLSFNRSHLTGYALPGDAPPPVVTAPGSPPPVVTAPGSPPPGSPPPGSLPPVVTPPGSSPPGAL